MTNEEKDSLIADLLEVCEGVINSVEGKDINISYDLLRKCCEAVDKAKQPKDVATLFLKWGSIKDYSNMSYEQKYIIEQCEALKNTITGPQYTIARHKELIYELIDTMEDYNIYNDWDGTRYTKEEAKEYIMSYGEKRMKEFIKEYFEQDNCSTAYLIYFCIRDIEWEASPFPDVGDSYVVFNEDRDIVYRIGTAEEVMQKMYNHEDFKTPPDFCSPTNWIEEWNELNEEYGLIVSEKKTFVNRGMFLLKSEAERHLEVNSHHYTDEAHVYCVHAWRAPKQAEFFEQLKEFAEKTTWNTTDLPPEGVVVLVTDGKTIEQGFFEDNEWCFSYHSLSKVVAWMPMPEIYKENI